MKLLETIRCENGALINLSYHQKRMNDARRALFACKDDIDLAQTAFPEPGQNETGPGLYKCRIIYTRQIEKIELRRYILPSIKSLKIVYDDQIDYRFKYLDRSHLDRLFQKKSNCDDILIVKNGLVTDTSYANILFFNGKNWLTPARPLLKGTQRAMLLAKEKIKPADIRLTDLQHFSKARLVNAMIRFEDELDIEIDRLYGVR